MGVLKRPGRELDHLTPSVVEVRMSGAIPLLRNTLSWPGHGQRYLLLYHVVYYCLFSRRFVWLALSVIATAVRLSKRVGGAVRYNNLHQLERFGQAGEAEQ